MRISLRDPNGKELDFGISDGQGAPAEAMIFDPTTERSRDRHGLDGF
jgi:hypothetical protein